MSTVVAGRLAVAVAALFVARLSISEGLVAVTWMRAAAFLALSTVCLVLAVWLTVATALRWWRS